MSHESKDGKNDETGQKAGQTIDRASYDCISFSIAKCRESEGYAN
jgi:hypothetical protein